MMLYSLGPLILSAQNAQFQYRWICNWWGRQILLQLWLGWSFRSICAVKKTVTYGSMYVKEQSLDSISKYMLNFKQQKLVLQSCFINPTNTSPNLVTILPTTFKCIWSSICCNTNRVIIWHCMEVFSCYYFKACKNANLIMCLLLVDLTSWGQNSSSMIARHHTMVLNPRGADLVATLQASK